MKFNYLNKMKTGLTRKEGNQGILICSLFLGAILGFLWWANSFATTHGNYKEVSLYNYVSVILIGFLLFLLTWIIASRSEKNAAGFIIGFVGFAFSAIALFVSDYLLNGPFINWFNTITGGMLNFGPNAILLTWFVCIEVCTILIHLGSFLGRVIKRITRFSKKAVKDNF